MPMKEYTLATEKNSNYTILENERIFMNKLMTRIMLFAHCDVCKTGVNYDCVMIPINIYRLFEDSKFFSPVITTSNNGIITVGKISNMDVLIDLTISSNYILLTHNRTTLREHSLNLILDNADPLEVIKINIIDDHFLI